MRTLRYAKELSNLIDEIMADEISGCIDYDKTSERIVDLAYRYGHDLEEANRTIESVFQALEARINEHLRKERKENA